MTEPITHPGQPTGRPVHPVVLATCALLVAHFRNLHEQGGKGFHTRLFSHMLHPEQHFVFAGRSAAVQPGVPTHPEHVVPCAVLISECRRLITEGATDTYITTLLAKHWKVATITKAEQQRLDIALGYKSKMPTGWRFEDGDTFARLQTADIALTQ